MSKLRIRAKSTIKRITPGGTNVDIEFSKDSNIVPFAKAAIHALVQSEGTAGALEIIREKMSKYDSDYEGL